MKNLIGKNITAQIGTYEKFVGIVADANDKAVLVHYRTDITTYKFEARNLDYKYQAWVPLTHVQGNDTLTIKPSFIRSNKFKASLIA